MKDILCICACLHEILIQFFAGNYAPLKVFEVCPKLNIPLKHFFLRNYVETAVQHFMLLYSWRGAVHRKLSFDFLRGLRSWSTKICYIVHIVWNRFIDLNNIKAIWLCFVKCYPNMKLVFLLLPMFDYNWPSDCSLIIHSTDNHLCSIHAMLDRGVCELAHSFFIHNYYALEKYLYVLR